MTPEIFKALEAIKKDIKNCQYAISVLAKTPMLPTSNGEEIESYNYLKVVEYQLKAMLHSMEIEAKKPEPVPVEEPEPPAAA